MITELGVAEAGVRLRNINPEITPLGRCHHQGRVPTMTVNWTLVTPGPSPKSELGLQHRGFKFLPNQVVRKKTVGSNPTAQ